MSLQVWRGVALCLCLGLPLSLAPFQVFTRQWETHLSVTQTSPVLEAQPEDTWACTNTWAVPEKHVVITYDFKSRRIFRNQFEKSSTLAEIPATSLPQSQCNCRRRKIYPLDMIGKSFTLGIAKRCNMVPENLNICYLIPTFFLLISLFSKYVKVNICSVI